MNPYPIYTESFFGVEVSTPINEASIKQVAKHNLIFFRDYWHKVDQLDFEKTKKSEFRFIEESEMIRCNFFKFIAAHASSKEEADNQVHLFWHHLHLYSLEENTNTSNIEESPTALQHKVDGEGSLCSLRIIVRIGLLALGIGALYLCDYFNNLSPT